MNTSLLPGQKMKYQGNYPQRFNFEPFVTISRIKVGFAGTLYYGFKEIPGYEFDSHNFIPYTPKSEIFQGLYNKLL